MLRKGEGLSRVNTMSPQDMQRVAEGLGFLLEWLKRGKQPQASRQKNSDGNYLPDVLQISEIAVLLNISKGKAYKLCKQPGFPAVRLGRRILVRRDRLMTWLEKQTAIK